MPKVWEWLGPEVRIFGPSAIGQYQLPSVMLPMSKHDIREFRDNHAQTVKHLREAGYDGVEVHASHSALLEYFLSPSFNRRTDEYGGSAANRTRFLLEVLHVCR